MKNEPIKKSLPVKRKSTGDDAVVVGLDIGSSSAKFILMRKEAGRCLITKFGKVEFPDMDVSKLDKVLPLAVKKLLVENNISKGNVVMSLSGMDVCVKSIRLPMMSEKEISEAVTWSIKKYIPFPLHDMVFSYLPPREIDDLGVKKYEVVFLAAKKSVVNKYINLSHAVGLKLICLTSDCFSLWNMIKMMAPPEEGIAVAILDIGHMQADISIFKDHHFVFTRNVPLGSGVVDQAIIENVNLADNKISLKSEEARHIKEGLDSLNSDRRPSIPGQSVVSAVNSYLEEVVKELELSFGHYRQLSHGDDISKVIVSGRGSRLKGLKDHISKKLGVPLEFISSFEKADVPIEIDKSNLDGQGSLYAVSLGAALADPSGLNLVSSKKTKSEAVSKENKSFVALAVIIVSILMGILLTFKIFEMVMALEIKKVKSELCSWQPKLKSTLDVKRGLFALMAKNAFYAGLTKSEAPWQVAFREISGILNSQESVTLEEIKVFTEGKDDILKIEIDASISHAQRPESILGEFMSSVEGAGIFKDIAVSSPRRAGVGESDFYFRLSCMAKGEPKKKTE